MVGVVQLVEHQVVILAVAGSSPVAHPSGTPEDVERHFRGFFWFVRQPQSPLHPKWVGWRPRQIARSRATRARAERTYLSSPQIDRKPLSLTSGWPERRKSPTRNHSGDGCGSQTPATVPSRTCRSYAETLSWMTFRFSCIAAILDRINSSCDCKSESRSFSFPGPDLTRAANSRIVAIGIPESRKRLHSFNQETSLSEYTRRPPAERATS